MKTRNIANKKIKAIGLGAMALDEYKPKPNDNDAIELLKHATKLNIGLIDTADVYGLGRNEILIGKALTQEQKNKIIIATKAGCTRPFGYLWGTNGKPEHIKQAIIKSLERLNIKQIELYQFHAPDDKIPFKESINAFKKLQEQGLIKHFGLSNVDLIQLQEAQKIIEVVSVQNHFNLANKQDEKELLPYLTRNKIAYLPYFPLGSGSLVKNKKIIEISQNLNITPSQLILSWIITKWPTAIPIPGTSNKLHLENNIKAVEVELSEKIILELDSLF